MPGRSAKPSWPLLLALAVVVAVIGAGLAIEHGPRRGGHFRHLKALVQATEAAYPNALWRVVHDLCVKDQASVGNPAPCMQVDLQKGFALIKDPQRRTQLLLTPTARITGIESPALTRPGAENYWQDAWRAKALFERQLGRPVPREDFGLAINSAFSRTQEQLHIHIDCVRPQARAMLEGRPLARRWTPLPGHMFGFTYEAMWLSGPDLEANPFELLARDPRARSRMGAYALVVIGARSPDGAPGFVLLRSRETPANFGHASGEVLLDHRCQILQQPAPAIPLAAELARSR